MKDLLARMLDLDSGSTLDAWNLSLQSGWPVAVLIFLLIIAAVGAVLLYLREKAVHPPVRMMLAVIRMLAGAVLLIMMFRPVIEATITRLKQSTVLVLLDRSNSMNIRDTRKESADLVEAGITLGRLPPVVSEFAEGVFSARIKVLTSAGLLREGDRDAAEKQIAELDVALASVEQMTSTLVPALDKSILAELESLREGLNTLTVKPLSTDEDHFKRAGMLDDIEEDLNKWYEQAVVSQSSMDDAMRAELALVSRRELVDAAVQTLSHTTFHEISDRSRLRMFSFSGGLEELSITPADTAAESEIQANEVQPAVSPLPEAVTGGSATALGHALESALDRSAGELVSTVVVLTDGANNTGSDPLEAAGKLRELGVRLVSVGVGLPEPDDARLRNLVAPKVVFADDLVMVRVQCHATGYENRTATLVAKLDGVEVARRTILFTTRTHFEELSFNATGFSGDHELEISLTALPGEATIENNVLRRNLRVLDDKIRVLYIEGSPRWEYRYIRAVLKRDPRVDVQFINTEGDKELAQASAEHLGRFPESEARAFQYDLVILGDVRASLFTPTQLELMERLVQERGGSLICLAGRKHLPEEYVDTPISAMLPVRFDQEPWQEVSDSLHPVLTVEGRSSTVMSLADSNSKSQSLWSNVRPLFKVPPVIGAKPGAHILAELSDSSQPMPLIAWQRYGSGKVMFIGADQLWRLRARTGDTYHLKFWGQAIQFLTLSRLLGENRLVQLQTGRERYALDESVEVFASAVNDIYQPLTDPTLTVRVLDVENAGEETLTLKSVPNTPGLYHGLYAPHSIGRYRVTTEADTASGGLTLVSSAAGGGAPLDVQFEVLDETSEQVQTAMQRELLAQMANVTGGQYLTLRDLPLLPKLVPEETSTAIYTREFELWDHWIFALFFVGLVAVEWTWRRYRNLA